MNKKGYWLILLSGSLLLNLAVAQPFTDVTAVSGLIHTHSNDATQIREAMRIAGGGAVADYDQDGDPDVYLVGGGGLRNALFRNNGNGTFTDVSAGSGTDIDNVLGSGPLFADVDGDKDFDLITFSIQRFDQPMDADPDLLENRPRLLINDGTGIFTDSPELSGFDSGMPSFGGAMADLDLDGDLDMFMSHWTQNSDGFQFFWENDGTGHFTDVTDAYLGSQVASLDRFSFTANVTDINNDSWPDVLLSSDFGTSRIFISNGISDGQLTFTVSKPPVISDENGMGAALGDYDNDGDMDWFISSIWDPDFEAEGNWGITGNRLYRNMGNGEFEDVTTASGVRRGFWGWGSCFADFNNDGNLDIYHENGFSISQAEEFFEDPSRLFMSDGDGTFTEASAANGLDHTGQGRGVSCFDYDSDGDLDILVIPNDAAVRLYRNDAPLTKRYLNVVLFDSGPNPFAVGAKIQLQTIEGQQLRQVLLGSNFVSNNPLEQHFGFGEQSMPQSITVQWPDESSKLIVGPISTNQTLSVSRYCHTSYQLQIMSDEDANITLNVNQPDGMPISAIDVELSVESGPHVGVTQTQQTDSNGVVQFVLNNLGVGQDHIGFQFMADEAQQSCRAIINWDPEQILLRSGFEALSEIN